VRKRLGNEIDLEPRMEHTMRQVDSRFSSNVHTTRDLSTQIRNRPELIFINSAKTETGMKVVM